MAGCADAQGFAALPGATAAFAHLAPARDPRAQHASVNETCSSDPDGGSSEPPGPRHLAIRGALDIDDSLERASAPTLKSTSALIRSSTTKRDRSDVCAAVAELGQGYVLPAVSGSELGGGEAITLGHDGRRRYLWRRLWVDPFSAAGWIHPHGVTAAG